MNQILLEIITFIAIVAVFVVGMFMFAAPEHRPNIQPRLDTAYEFPTKTIASLNAKLWGRVSANPNPIQ